MKKLLPLLLLVLGYASGNAQEYHYLRSVDNVDIYYHFNNKSEMLFLKLTNHRAEKVYAGPGNVLWYNGALQVEKQNGGGIILQPGETSGFGLFWNYPKGYQQGYTFRLENFTVEIGGQGKDPRYHKSGGSGSNKNNNKDPLPEIVFPGDDPQSGKKEEQPSKGGSSKKDEETTATNAGTKPSITNVNTAQRQQYQNQANYYLNLGQNDNQSSISKQLNLDLAKTNAYMSGNSQQLQQIQQQQDQQNKQNSQQLTQSVVNFVGAVGNLMEVNRQRRLEQDRIMEESRARWQEQGRREHRAMNEVKKLIEPIRQESLSFIDQGLELDSITYTGSTDPAQKMALSMSWLLKQKEKRLIKTSVPDLYVFSDGSYTVHSPGHITPSPIALVDGGQLADSFSLQTLKPSFYNGRKDFAYSFKLPHKARKNFKRTLNFLYSDNKSIDILYAKASHYAQEGYGASYVPREVADIARLNYTPNPGQNYRQDFEQTYAYYKGHSWKSIYSGGYWALKKINASTIYGNILLDSAIAKHDISGISKAVQQYSQCFNWYYDNFSQVETVKHPVYLLDELFLNYASAIMILKKSTADGTTDPSLHFDELTAKYLTDFDHYKIFTKNRDQYNMVTP